MGKTMQEIGTGNREKNDDGIEPEGVDGGVIES
jgi:hypothetical protein